MGKRKHPRVVHLYNQVCFAGPLADFEATQPNLRTIDSGPGGFRGSVRFWAPYTLGGEQLGCFGEAMPFLTSTRQPEGYKAQNVESKGQPVWHLLPEYRAI